MTSVLGEGVSLPISLVLHLSTSPFPGRLDFQAKIEAPPGAGECFPPCLAGFTLPQPGRLCVHPQRLLGITVELWGLHKIYP